MPLRKIGGNGVAIGFLLVVCSYALAENVSWDGVVFYLGFGLMIVGTIAHVVGLIQDRRNK
jgi:hypothetical protein